jgi:hypothetical protein
MDAFTLASAFAQIVSLLAVYKSELTSEDQRAAQDFLIWLEKNNHQELKSMLEAHTESLQGVHFLLNEQQEAFLGRLQGIDELLAQIASRIEGFGAIAHAVRPGIQLSEQAISILKQLDQSGASGFSEIGDPDPKRGVVRSTLIIRGTAGRKHIEYHEDRFIHDDLRTLVGSGFLQPSYNSANNPAFEITRAGVRYVSMLGS